MSRISKIALLPRDVREDLNARIRDGESGPPLLEWLNGLPQVKELVSRRFAGVGISPANLSAWRRGGYRYWLVNREALDLAGDLLGDAGSLRDGREPGALAEGMSAIVEAKLARVLQNWGRIGEKQFERELQVLRVVSREVARTRKGNQNGVRLELKKDRDANWMEAYTTKQWTKMLWEWAQKSSKISSWLRRKWPCEDDAVRYFWDCLDYPREKIEKIMPEPDKVPPWEKWWEKEAEPDARAEGGKPENN